MSDSNLKRFWEAERSVEEHGPIAHMVLGYLLGRVEPDVADDAIRYAVDYVTEHGS